MLSIIIKLGLHTYSFYSTINFGSNHCGSPFHLNIMNDASSAILDMDRVTCLFDGFISSDFSIVVILILLELCSLLSHMLLLTIFDYLQCSGVV